MKNLFNVMQQYAAKYRGGSTSGVSMKSVHDMNGGGEVDVTMSERYMGASSFLRKKKGLPPVRGVAGGNRIDM